MKKSSLLFACAALSAFALVAQEHQKMEQYVSVRKAPQTAQAVAMSGDHVAFVSAMPSAKALVKNAPYTAEATTETVQVLADGNRIVRKSTSKMARDSEGRTRREDNLSAIGPFSTGAPRILTFIHNPVTRESITLEADTKTARRMVAPANIGNGDRVEFRYPATASGATLGGIMGQRTVTSTTTTTMTHSAGDVVTHTVTNPGDTKSESLGKRTIEGVQCDGTRVTTTIAAGTMGNERPIVIVTESWYSPELQMMIQTKTTDPRLGETSFTVSNISRNEPVKSLFEVPADYKVVDAVMHVVPAKKD